MGGDSINQPRKRKVAYNLKLQSCEARKVLRHAANFTYIASKAAWCKDVTGSTEDPSFEIKPKKKKTKNEVETNFGRENLQENNNHTVGYSGKTEKDCTLGASLQTTSARKMSVFREACPIQHTGVHTKTTAMAGTPFLPFSAQWQPQDCVSVFMTRLVLA